MSLIQTPWTSQPQGAVGIDWSNPIAAKLSAAATPFANYAKSKPVELKAERNGSGVFVSGGLGGLGFTGRGDSTNVYRLHSVVNATTTAWEEPSSSATWIAVLVKNGNTSGNAPIFGNLTPSTSPYSAYSISDQSGVGNLTFECSAGGAYRSISLAGGLTTNKLHVCVGRYNGSVLEGFINGTKLASTQACTGNLSYPSDASRGPAVGNFWNFTGASRSFNGSVYLVAVWPVALSDAEIRSISDNPWQIFKPLPRRIFVPVSAGGGTTAVTADHNASYTITGSVAADASAAYAIRAAVTADATASYALRAAAQADQAAAYSIRAAVASDLAGSYAIQTAGTVTTGLDAAYAVRGAVAGDISVGYQIAAAVQAEVTAAYAVRAAVQKDLSAGYAIDAGVSSVAATLSAAYWIDGEAVILTPDDKFTARGAARNKTVAAAARRYQIATRSS